MDGTTYLDQVLALSLSDERLKLGRGEGVDKTGLGHDEQQNLGSRENRKLVGLGGQRCRVVSQMMVQLRAR